jgi:hypothetical protein
MAAQKLEDRGVAFFRHFAQIAMPAAFDQD